MTDITVTESVAGIDSVLTRNRSFAAAGGHEGASLFPNLGLVVVTCLDARVDPAHILGVGLGDALVMRNNGGRITPQVIDDLAYVSQLAEAARPDGPLFEVAVIQHTQCGVARASALRSRSTSLATAAGSRSPDMSTTSPTA